MRNILYFVGSGLTKSLALPDKPVPLMNDFIHVLGSYLHDDAILTALAKLEMNNPYPYTWKDSSAIALAGKLTEDGSDRSVEKRKAFECALKNKPVESIEDLLGRLDWEAATHFIYAVNRLFYLVNWDVNWWPLERFLQKQFALKDARHTFISFNYDLILDRAVQRHSAGKWHVRTGYGFEISCCIEKDSSPTSQASVLCSSSEASSHIRVLKPHGSLNWLVPLKIPYEPSTCGLAFRDGPVIVPVTEERELRNSRRSKDFQKVSCPDGALREVLPCIIPPVAAKHSDLSFIKEIRTQEHETVKEATEVYVLGWSMPKTDIEHKRAIQSTISDRREGLENVTVVNRGETPDYFERVACTFGIKKSRLAVFNAGFCQFVTEAV